MKYQITGARGRAKIMAKTHDVGKFYWHLMTYPVKPPVVLERAETQEIEEPYRFGKGWCFSMAIQQKTFWNIKRVERKKTKRFRDMKNKVVCIWNGPSSILSDKTQSLTIGKVYESDDDLYEKRENVKTDVSVINDNGKETVYTSDRFVTMKEAREMRLKEIGI